MPYLFLVGAVISNASASIINGFYTRKNKERKNAGVGFFNLIYASFACLSWLVMFLIVPSFSWEVVPYAIGFGLFYVCGTTGYMRALKTGPILLTSLFVSLSLIGVTVWGFIFWNTPFTWLVALGLALVVIAIYLCLNKGKNESEEKDENAPKISLKWLFFVVMGFVGNAGCTIVQRTQQTAHAGAHGNLLMVIATAVASIILGVVYFKQDDLSEFKPIMKTTGFLPMTAGVANFLLNLFVMLLAGTSLSPSLIYPVISVACLACVSVASVFLFKEKMKWWQWLGVLIGGAAVAILSL